MRAEELMTTNVACCSPDDRLQDVAAMMVANDCGAIPVIDGNDSKRIMGIITDRDIVVRTLAEGRNPLDMAARDVMTHDVSTVTPQTSAEDLLNLMESRQVRRVPVVNERGSLVGIVAQADVARRAPAGKTAEVVKEVSEQR